MRIDQVERAREHESKRTEGLRIMFWSRHQKTPDEWGFSRAEERDYWRDRMRNSIAILRALRRGLAGLT
jgi:hypothetical protein